jgi:N-acyl-D-amino-acid deacylase
MMKRTSRTTAVEFAILAGLMVAGAGMVRLKPDTTYLHAQAPQPYDLVIRNGRIIDGTGSPWYRADVAVRGDTIALIAPSITDPAGQVIDANGQIVSPGFIDIHNHARETIFQLPSADNYIRQGVTTLIEGPDGGSPVPLGPFLDKLEATQKSINIGTFIGQGSVREAVIGRANRRPTPAELDKMRAFVEDGMKAGAFGMSTGLFYVPGAFTPIEEVVELAKVAAKYGGIHISHMRDEAFGVLDSVRETIRIGEEGGLPTQVSPRR